MRTLNIGDIVLFVERPGQHIGLLGHVERVTGSRSAIVAGDERQVRWIAENVWACETVRLPETVRPLLPKHIRVPRPVPRPAPKPPRAKSQPTAAELLALLQCAKPNLIWTPERLAAKLHVSERTVREYLLAMHRRGEIQRVRLAGRGGPSGYCLVHRSTCTQRPMSTRKQNKQWVAQMAAKGFKWRCPVCYMISKRSLWSIAHIDEEQQVKCACGLTLILPPERDPHS